MAKDAGASTSAAIPEQPAAVLSDADRESLRLLAQHVARAFYDPRLVVVVDQLTRHTVIKEDELAGRLGYATKEVSKMVGPLIDARIVENYNQNELRDPNGNNTRTTNKRYYYMDFLRFVNVIKWRMAEMRRKLEAEMRIELATKGYTCTQCKKVFGMLDVHHLLDPMRGFFACDACDGELADRTGPGDANGDNDRMQRFNAQTQWIRESLRKTDGMVIPAFDPRLWIKKNMVPTANATGEGTTKDDGLAIAGARGTGKAMTSKLSVEIVNEEDDEARRQEKQSEANAKRQQNAMPTWHTHSTITGDVTAVGVTHTPSTQSGKSSQATKSTNPDDVKLALREHVTESVNDYYDNLAQEALSQESSETFVMNMNGKRARSDIDAVSPATTTSTPTVDPAKDPIVHVNGKPMRYSEVKEEHHDLMTPEEYTEFYTVSESLGFM